MNTEINCVKDYLCNNKTRFGILDNVPETEYLNITAQNVRFIATKQIRTSIPLPSVNGILNNCRGIINYPGVIDTSYASFRVTDAHEELVHCDISLFNGAPNVNYHTCNFICVCIIQSPLDYVRHIR